MIDQYKQAFQEEARELLSELESALLELDQKRQDPEVVGRAFRALHTIKGSGAMFGFDNIAAFAHNLETAFDRLRNGQLTATADLINLTLAAGDQIKTMLDEASGHGVVDHARTAGILELLQLLTGPDPNPDTHPEVHPIAVPQFALTQAAGHQAAGHQAAGHQAAGHQVAGPQFAEPAALARTWQIHFRPSSNALLNGANPLLLLAELRALGELRITLDTGSIPPLAEMDAELCYLAWDMLLVTPAAVEAIRDVFIFVEDESELAIEPASEAAEPDRVVSRDILDILDIPDMQDMREGTSPRGAPAASDRQDSPVSQGTAPNLPALPVREAKPRLREGTVAAAQAASNIRVSTEKLDQLVNLVGELVTVQARLSAVAGRRDDADIVDISEAVDRLTAALRENTMSIRMLPLRSTFERFRRLVHDLGVELHKEVDFTIEGADTELDKTVIDQLNDPLVHLIRNSMDHGIEAPEIRRAAGKDPVGTIHLSARHTGASVLIQIADDGRGLDVEAVRARAAERGLIDAAARLSESEVLSLILTPGFSTARQVSGVSGRGVGMDVVRRSIEGLRGSIDISSRPGEGLTATLRLPLTLAIIDGLLVRVANSHFILPLANSLECIELTRRDIEDAHGKHIANVRGQLIPYIRLSEYFQMDAERPEREQIMVVETDQGHYGFVVDQVLGDHQTVIKNLGRLYRNVQVVSGATILGDGTVALILDPHRLVQNVVQNVAQNQARSRLADGRKTLHANRGDAESAHNPPPVSKGSIHGT